MNRINTFEDNHGIQNDFKASFDPTKFERRPEPKYTSNDTKSNFSHGNYDSKYPNTVSRQNYESQMAKNPYETQPNYGVCPELVKSRNLTGEGFFKRQNQGREHQRPYYDESNNFQRTGQLQTNYMGSQDRERQRPYYDEGTNFQRTEQLQTDYMGSIDKDLKNLLRDDQFRLTDPCRTENFRETIKTDYFRNTGMYSIDPNNQFINTQSNNNRNPSPYISDQKLSQNQRNDLEDKLLKG